MSTGFPWLQWEGRTRFSASSVATESSHNSAPPATRASAASTAGPPALVTIISLGPRVRGCRFNSSAMSNSSATVSTRSTPQRRKAASSTSSAPVIAPVCETAALAAAAVRPALTTMGFRERHLARRRQKGPDIAHRFHVQQDAAGGRVIAEVINEVAPSHIQHRAGGDKCTEAHLFPQAPVEDGRAQGPALAQERDVAGSRSLLRERGVQADGGIHQAEAVGAQQPQRGSRYRFLEPPLEFCAFRPPFPESSRDH